MSSKRLLFVSLISLLIIGGCKTGKNINSLNSTVMLDTVSIMPPTYREYQAAAKREHDLLHTSLNVSFDWEKQYLMGKATLTLKPYFYPTNTLTLDAKGFDLHEVSLVNKAGQRDTLPYKYDGMQVKIQLDKTYTSSDTFSIFIDYTAKPNELAEGGSDAISSDKGLYFINPTGSEPNKPRQIWTQGETEASSCWFPTIDKPNERSTQDIRMTVVDSFVTLSNGVLVESTKNENGTRTDHWKMNQAHAPYLFMMAVGDFAVVKDQWRGREVSYYVEPKYQPDARAIFGNTPEMMEFFSGLFGFDYPWDKYSQIVVRDFVSGAMENTTATIFFDNVQRTTRELKDEDYEYIIAHELVHHWFGDLVTCESWANLTLNEGFANYGEYLWIAHKYGEEEAEQHRYQELQGYLAEAKRDKKELIRFYYDDKEDMFDAHSYNKGGLVLNMLRNYLGDEAFFKGIKLYIHSHAFRSVEIHDLRLAFEKVSGEDLNWFFNQWYLAAGHPQLVLNYEYPSADSVAVTIEQTQDFDQYPVFRLPMAIDIYTDKSVTRHNVTMDRYYQRFTFAVDGAVKLVNVDADHLLVAEIKDNKTPSQMMYQYEHAPTYRDKREALERLAELQFAYSDAYELMVIALKDPNWDLRDYAVQYIAFDEQEKIDRVLPQLKTIAAGDPKSKVRTAALKKLDTLEDEKLLPFFKSCVKDSSYIVIGAALSGVYKLDPEEGYKQAQAFEQETNTDVVIAVSEAYSTEAGKEKQAYFERMIGLSSSYPLYILLTNYGAFLSRMEDVSVIRKGVVSLKEQALHTEPWWVRYGATAALHKVIEASRESAKNAEGANKEELQGLVSDLEAMLKEVKETETHKTLKARYGALN